MPTHSSARATKRRAVTSRLEGLLPDLFHHKDLVRLTGSQPHPICGVQSLEHRRNLMALLQKSLPTTALRIHGEPGNSSVSFWHAGIPMSSGFRMTWLRSFQPTRLQILDEDDNRRNNTQRKNGTDEKAPKDNRADRLLSVSAGIPCNNNGKETCQRGNGRHQKGSQSRFCSFESRFSCPQAIS